MIHTAVKEQHRQACSYNFSAGPAMLPGEVMQQARAELCDWQGNGFSVLEVSHRSDKFMELAHTVEAELRDLYRIPDDYEVLFLAGGASLQFAMVPMNLITGADGSADYLHSGYWSGLALEEAKKYCTPHIACSAAASDFTAIPPQVEWDLHTDSAYAYFAMNETLLGVEFHHIPDCGQLPLVTDMTSNFLSRPLDISRFGVIFAGAQKNIAPAGMTVVIVHRSLLQRARPDCPRVCHYATQAAAGSMSNTPPVFNWYMAGLVFSWLQGIGGLEAIAARNDRKAESLYAFIDHSAFYANRVNVACRSRMNVSFELTQSDLNDTFLQAAETAGLYGLRGHRQVGGMRASIYNAMPPEGVQALIDFMADFERRYG